MSYDRRNREHLLLDFHLDQLDDDTRAWLEAELLRDAELRAKSDRLGEILRPLDHWSVGPAPASLVDKVLASVRGASEPGLADAPPLGRAEGHRPRSPFSLREVVAVAASIVLLFAMFGPGLSSVRAKSQRALCASNLASIFRGVSLYQQGSNGALPYAGTNPIAAWLPAAEQRPFESNSRHPYLIAKLSFARPEDFVCPSCKPGNPMRADELADHRDFVRSCNMSYASLNLAGASPNLRPPAPIPYMSDQNPLFVNARFNAHVDPAKANSPVHDGGGQSVLVLDGSVRWLTSPVYGTNQDNVWLAGQIRSYVGTETATREDDAFLIPGYPDLASAQSTQPRQ